MSGLRRPPRIVETGAQPEAAAAQGATVAVGDVDGRVHVFAGGQEPRSATAHDGGVLSLCADPAGGFLSGGDDGRAVRVRTDGTVETLAEMPGQWVGHVAAAPGLRAAAAGKTVTVWREGAPRPDTLEHPNTVGGLAFDAKGRRLAVAHYGGVTLWEPAKRGWKPSKLLWKGSHLAVTISPDARFVVTSMQEAALHGWRLRDKADMRMSGYPARVRSMAWVADGAFLATSGADAAVCWPCDGPGGPMGRAPAMVSPRPGLRVTAVCGLPGTPFLAAGYEDGAVALAEVLDGAEGRALALGNGAAAVVLAATADSGHLLAGDANGRLSWFALRG